MLGSIVKAVKEIDSLDARAALREELSRVIEKAVVHQSAGYLEIYFRGMGAPVVQPLRTNATLPGMQHKMMNQTEYATLLNDQQQTRQ